MEYDSLDNFFKGSLERRRADDFFHLVTEHIVEVNLQDKIIGKLGSVISYSGIIQFTTEHELSFHALGKMKKPFIGEGISLMKAEGEGRIYLADQGKKIIILDLEDDIISVNSNNLLAFEPTIHAEVHLMRVDLGTKAAGLFNITLKGTGRIAITSHLRPLTLKVTKEYPVVTNPYTTLAWSGDVKSEVRADKSLKAFIGNKDGEALQLLFSGEGFVVVQPIEEIYL